MEEKDREGEADVGKGQSSGGEDGGDPNGEARAGAEEGSGRVGRVLERTVCSSFLHCSLAVEERAGVLVF